MFEIQSQVLNINSKSLRLTIARLSFISLRFGFRKEDRQCRCLR
jgi:hypothetical protein